MKIIDTTRKKYAIDFPEDEDHYTDDTGEILREYESFNNNDLNMVDTTPDEPPLYDVSEIESGIDDILVDTIGEEPQDEVGTEPEQEMVDDTVQEGTEIDERVPDFATTEHALQWALENNRVVEIFYVTQGKNRGRGGRLLRRERGLIPDEEKGGVHIHRIVEPHHMFQAGNGNLILVTYDRSVRHIRAFIVNNIYDFNFTKNRKTGKDQYFKPRMRVMPKSEKGIKTMENTKEKLTKLASTLEDKGLKKSSLILREAIKAATNFKMAQYVGIQAYWLKNRRCWDNCYRQKRTSSPSTPAQKVWMECWDEYKDSINNDKSTWGKYAGTDESLKVGSKEEKEWNSIFAEKVEEKVKEGMKRPVAVYETIEEESQKYSQKVIEASADLMTLADSLSKGGYDELGKEMVEAAMEMLKEAQFAGG